MVQESCGTCHFYMASPRVCRRYPPHPMVVGIKQGLANVNQHEPMISAFFPTMLPTGWCGEYRPEEEKMMEH
jgi:hypothetical protein